MCIHRRRLSDLNVFGLGFGDLQFRLQPLRLHHFRERRARRHELADLQRLFLQNSVDPGAHPQAVELALLQLCQRAKLLHLGLLGLQLRLQHFAAVGQPLLLDVIRVESSSAF